MTSLDKEKEEGVKKRKMKKKFRIKGKKIKEIITLTK